MLLCRVCSRLLLLTRLLLLLLLLLLRLLHRCLPSTSSCHCCLASWRRVGIHCSLWR
jgi:hypothetical protein